MIAAALALSLFLNVDATSAAPSGLPPQLEGVGIDQRLGEQVPLDIVLRDESGRAISLGDRLAKGKPVILALVYYECPMLCNLVLTGLLTTVRAVKLDAGTDYDIVAVSFDPRDTPQLAAEKKKNFVHEYRRPGAEGGWHFLTGEKAEVDRLTKAVGFRYKWDEEKKQFYHAASIVVLTPEGKVSKYFYGVEYSPRDVRLGLVEAAEGKIGTKIDQAFLYCFAYDPATGKYGVIVMRLVRIGGVLTVLGIIAFWLLAGRVIGSGPGSGPGQKPPGAPA